MADIERRRLWSELPKRGKDMILAEMGPDFVSQIDELVESMRKYGLRIKAERQIGHRGMPTELSLVKLSSDSTRGFILSLNLPDDRGMSSSIRIEDENFPKGIKQVQMVCLGEDNIGLRILRGKKNLKLADNPLVAKGILDNLRQLLVAKEIFVEVGRFVRPYVCESAKIWQSISKETLP